MTKRCKNCTCELVGVVFFGILFFLGSGGFFWVATTMNDGSDIQTNCTVVGYDVTNKTCSICTGSNVFTYRCWDYNYTGYVIYKYSIFNYKTLIHNFNMECGKNITLYKDLEEYYPMGHKFPCYYYKTHPDQVALGTIPSGTTLYVLGGVFAGLGLLALLISIKGCCKKMKHKYTDL